MKEKTKQALRCISQFIIAAALMGWLAYAFTGCSANQECPAYSKNILPDPHISDIS